MYLDLQEPDKVTNPLSPKVVPPCYSLHLQLHIFKVDFCNFLFLSLSLMMTFDAWLKVLFHWWSKQNCGHQKNMLYVCWKILQTVNAIFHLQYALYGNLLTGWTCEVLLDALSLKKYYAAVFLWIHVHVKWNHVGFDSLCISTSYLLAIVSVMGPSHSKLSWEMLSAQLFIYWHLFHCAVTYMYMYMSIYFVFIETNYNKYYILSCIVLCF